MNIKVGNKGFDHKSQLLAIYMRSFRSIHSASL